MGAGTPHRWIFEIIDPATRCIVHDLEVHDLARFCEVIDCDPADMEPGAAYELEASEVALVVAAFGIPFEPSGQEGLLRPAGLVDQLPYKVHTDRELLMMLSGAKPLAVFHDSHPSTRPPFEIIPEDVFAPHVAAGRFVSREVILPPDDPGRDRATRIVCYALPTEQWRIDAYLLLRQAGSKFGWSETCERMEGTLLGYTNEQNDAYIEMIYRRRVARFTRGGPS